MSKFGDFFLKQIFWPIIDVYVAKKQIKEKKFCICKKITSEKRAFRVACGIKPFTTVAHNMEQ
jgi:hypothetical protein